MADIRKFPIFEHLRGNPSAHILRYRNGRLIRSGRGISFWFMPLSTSMVEIPLDDREFPFLFHGRSRDFQDVVIQGVITVRVIDPEILANRIDFSISPVSGRYVGEPLERLDGLLTELAQQFAGNYLTHTDLSAILENGLAEARRRILDGFHEDAEFADMGIEIVAVRINAVNPEPEVEKALQTPAREAIQQQADEASFARRAMAVEKERAIQENELQNKIELARRESDFIAQQGENGRKRASEQAEAALIETTGESERTTIAAKAEAMRTDLVEKARNEAERARMQIYRDFPTDRLFALATQKLAGKLNRIEHLNLSPDLLGGLLTNLVGAGVRKLEQEEKQ